MDEKIQKESLDLKNNEDQNAQQKHPTPWEHGVYSVKHGNTTKEKASILRTEIILNQTVCHADKTI